METLLRYLQVRALRRGTQRRNTVWFVIGAALWILLRLRRDEEVVYRTKLLPGECLVVEAGRSGPTPRPGS